MNKHKSFFLGIMLLGSINLFSQQMNRYYVQFGGRVKVNVSASNRAKINHLFGNVLGKRVEKHKQFDRIHFDGGGFVAFVYFEDNSSILENKSDYLKSMQVGLLVPSSQYNQMILDLRKAGVQDMLPNTEPYSDHSKFYYFHIPGNQVFRLVNTQDEELLGNKDEYEIRQVLDSYVDGWLEMDESKVMGLFTENAVIQPNLLTPIEGKSKIKEFWFPRDGSKTLINEFKTNLISIKIMDTLATSTDLTELDWSYQKDTLSYGVYQKGISTGVYAKQADGSWRIWRLMWTDIYAEQK